MMNSKLQIIQQVSQMEQQKLMIVEQGSQRAGLHFFDELCMSDNNNGNFVIVGNRPNNRSIFNYNPKISLSASMLNRNAQIASIGKVKKESSDIIDNRINSLDLNYPHIKQLKEIVTAISRDKKLIQQQNQKLRQQLELVKEKEKLLDKQHSIELLKLQRTRLIRQICDNKNINTEEILRQIQLIQPKQSPIIKKKKFRITQPVKREIIRLHKKDKLTVDQIHLKIQEVSSKQSIYRFIKQDRDKQVPTMNLRSKKIKKQVINTRSRKQ